MPVIYDMNEGFTIAPDHCEDCGEPLYDTGCDAPGCHGFFCPNCGTGCDRDVDPGGRCASAAEDESDEEYAERINTERAAFGLRPLSAEGATDG